MDFDLIEKTLPTERGTVGLGRRAKYFIRIKR